MLALVNAERRSRGIAPLSPNGALAHAAEDYARTLLRLNAFGHHAGGTDLLSRLRAAGYSGGPPLAEVLWRGSGTISPETAVAGWMDNASHRAIILNPVYREAGVGCSFRENGPRLEQRCVMDLAG